MMLMLCTIPALAESEATGTETSSPTTESTAPESGVPLPQPRLLSPGLANIAAHCDLRVSAAAGGTVIIVKDDFLRALNRKDIESISITSLPRISEGELTVSGVAIKVGDVISGDDLSKIEFVPSGSHITNSSFTFTEGDSAYEITGNIYMLAEANSVPVIRDISVGTIVSTYRELSYHGHLPGYDPDGDDIEYMIVSYPEKGALRIDRECGEYEYVPREGFTGKDSFEYVIVDEYGGYGASQTVVISVESVNSDELYADMADSKSYSEAIALTRDGVLGGRNIGGMRMFLPKSEVTRGEFVTMLMNCTDTELKESTVHTVFADDESIHSNMKAAIASAYELGYISGTEIEGKLYFMPDEIITIAECASIIGNVLSIDTEISIPVASVIEGCPEEAYVAVNSLCSVSILPHDDGSLNVNQKLTREYAAKVLGNIKTFINLYSAS